MKYLRLKPTFPQTQGIIKRLKVLVVSSMTNQFICLEGRRKGQDYIEQNTVYHIHL